MEINTKPDKPIFGLLQRREILLPTLRGWFLLLLMGAGLMFIAAKEIIPFLAITDPIPGGDLIVEGWIPDYALEQAIAEFKRNHYGKLYVTGGPIEENAATSDLMTYAERGAAIVRSKGIPSDAVQAVPAPHVDRDRTYTSAAALKNWQIEHGVTPRSYHVMTIGTHARRTRLLFEKALGEGAIVGITALDDRSYDSKHWWNTSAGVRTVIGETIAYGYARFLFWQTEQ